MTERVYLIINDENIFNMSDQGVSLLGRGVNPRGFTKNEIQNLKIQNDIDIVIDMLSDLSVLGVQKNFTNDTDLFLEWYYIYLNSPIMNKKEYSIPQTVCSNEEYLKKVFDTLNQYKSDIHNSINTKYEFSLLKDVDFVCDTLSTALYLGARYEIHEMDKEIKKLISYYLNDEFWVSELDQNYAFRGLAYYEKLHSQGSEQRYEELRENDLTFFRAVSQETVPDTKRMLNCPYSSLSYACAGRFSKQGVSCMYLGTTSYVCAKELGYNEKSDCDLYVSAIKFNDKGRRLKILNLALSKYLNIYTHGDNEIRKQIWLSHLKLYPIIIATSFIVKKHAVDEIKYEYLLSQSLMRTLKENGIDGIAYATKRDSNSDFAFPHNINLAILVDDVDEDDDYGILKSYLSITEPVKITQKLIDEISKSASGTEKHSFINQHFNDSSFNSKTHWLGDNVPYSRLPYSIFDDYLVNQEFIDGDKL